MRQITNIIGEHRFLGLQHQPYDVFNMTVWPSNIVIKAAGDKLLMNKFIRQNFGGGLTEVLSVWELIPLKRNRELGEW